MTIDLDKFEQLTKARKHSWLALHAAIGADSAAQAFATQCRRDMNAAAAADERAMTALNDFVKAHTTEPKEGE